MGQLRRLHRFLYLCPAFSKVWQQDCAALYRRPELFLEHVRPQKRQALLEAMRRARELPGDDGGDLPRGAPRPRLSRAG